jgi:hypothetical protein
MHRNTTGHLSTTSIKSVLNLRGREGIRQSSSVVHTRASQDEHDNVCSSDGTTLISMNDESSTHLAMSGRSRLRRGTYPHFYHHQVTPSPSATKKGNDDDHQIEGNAKEKKTTTNASRKLFTIQSETNQQTTPKITFSKVRDVEIVHSFESGASSKRLLAEKTISRRRKSIGKSYDSLAMLGTPIVKTPNKQTVASTESSGKKIMTLISGTYDTRKVVSVESIPKDRRHHSESTKRSALSDSGKGSKVVSATTDAHFMKSAKQEKLQRNQSIPSALVKIVAPVPLPKLRQPPTTSTESTSSESSWEESEAENEKFDQSVNAKYQRPTISSRSAPNPNSPKANMSSATVKKTSFQHKLQGISELESIQKKKRGRSPKYSVTSGAQRTPEIVSGEGVQKKQKRRQPTWIPSVSQTPGGDKGSMKKKRRRLSNFIIAEVESTSSKTPAVVVVAAHKVRSRLRKENLERNAPDEDNAQKRKRGVSPERSNDNDAIQRARTTAFETRRRDGGLLPMGNDFQERCLTNNEKEECYPKSFSLGVGPNKRQGRYLRDRYDTSISTVEKDHEEGCPKRSRLHLLDPSSCSKPNALEQIAAKNDFENVYSLCQGQRRPLELFRRVRLCQDSELERCSVDSICKLQRMVAVQQPKSAVPPSGPEAERYAGFRVLPLRHRQQSESPRRISEVRQVASNSPTSPVRRPQEILSRAKSHQTSVLSLRGKGEAVDGSQPKSPTCASRSESERFTEIIFSPSRCQQRSAPPTRFSSVRHTASNSAPSSPVRRRMQTVPEIQTDSVACRFDYSTKKLIIDTASVPEALVKEITNQVQECLKQGKDRTDDHGGKRPFHINGRHLIPHLQGVNNGQKVYRPSHERLSVNAGRHELDARSVMSELTNDFSKTEPAIRTEISQFPKTLYSFPVERSGLSIRLASSSGQEPKGDVKSMSSSVQRRKGFWNCSDSLAGSGAWSKERLPPPSRELHVPAEVALKNPSSSQRPTRVPMTGVSPPKFPLLGANCAGRCQEGNNANEASIAISVGNSNASQFRCGQCPGCQRETDCQTCESCLNTLRRFGPMPPPMGKEEGCRRRRCHRALRHCGHMDVLQRRGEISVGGREPTYVSSQLTIEAPTRARENLPESRNGDEQEPKLGAAANQCSWEEGDDWSVDYSYLSEPDHYRLGRSKWTKRSSNRNSSSSSVNSKRSWLFPFRRLRQQQADAQRRSSLSSVSTSIRSRPESIRAASLVGTAKHAENVRVVKRPRDPLYDLGLIQRSKKSRLIVPIESWKDDSKSLQALMRYDESDQVWV